MQDSKDIAAKEREDLRKELQFLKDCQFKYFLLSISATAALYGIAGKIDASPGLNLQSMAFLSALVVILPSWLIFFDKATTITRMAAYLSVLERYLLEDHPHEIQYAGWEYSLLLFRRLHKEKQPGADLKAHVRGFMFGLRRLLHFRSVHRYWVFSFYAFSATALISLFLAGSVGLIWPPKLQTVALVLTTLVFVQTLSVLGNLTDGIYDYSKLHKHWRSALTRESLDKFTALLQEVNETSSKKK